MLARTRTEPSVDANSIVGSFGSRTAITISSNDTPPRHHPPLRHDTVISITTSGSGTTQSSLVSDESSQHLAAGPSTGVHQSNIRTYAGKSRSFLVELPTGSFPGGAEEDDLGFEVRESYTDLRTRWGVDNSEDDPRPVSPSNSLPERDDHTENGHGAKGKGKGKDKPRISKVVLPPGMMNDLKSITELRSKGESRRFMDEVGYLFEGMGATAGIGVRRGSALEIVTKLCDPDFSRRAKATDFLSRAWDILRSAGAGDGDRILDSILIFFAALAAQSPRDLQELTNKPDFVATLWRMLPSVERGKDPITFLSGNFNDSELKKAGIGKSEKRMLASLSIAIVEKSGLSTSTACPPLRQLLSQALSAIPPSSHNLSQFSSLYETLILELELLPSRISAYAAGLSLLPEVSVPTRLQDLPQFEHVDNCLSILDSFLLGRWPDSDEPCDQSDDVVNGVDQEALGDGLISLCTACNILLSGELHEDFAPIGTHSCPLTILPSPDNSFKATRCLESSLRVLINLSHENLVWCRLLLHNEYTIPIVMSLIVNAQHNTPPAEIDEKPEVAEEGSRDARAFDRLCLALGLLTNLVQADDTAKDICRQTKLNASCPGSRLCARSCHCPARTNALDCLVQAYVHHRKLAADDEDPGISIVRGHLAVLLGLLMRESTPNERIVLTALPGTSQRAKLDSLVEAACEFVTLYTDFMARVARGEDQGEDHEDHLDDADRSSDAERHKAIQDRTSGVAKDVILFLEMLRDQ
ncbi:hypothetical protein BV25DRAFT_1964571 [Artomyces pyxidatus]|uniref:Uncharacterized protein n=1 Tax=Artomyces pyxidatus TaxID=48021 RepID=A0ACB8SRB0_9AGAM|nr:hypothetical protein BV25DRAFT_1964571 [Artomyces pyxidatus]